MNSASYTKSKVHPYENGPATDLPGYSKWVTNGTLYFEKWGFSARGSLRYRTSFIGEVSGFGANRTLRRALPQTIVDGQVGYEFQPNSALRGLSVYLQGLNLTEPVRLRAPEEPGSATVRLADVLGDRLQDGMTGRHRGAGPPGPIRPI